MTAAGLPREILPIPVPTPFAIGRVNCFLIPGTPTTLVDPGPNSTEALAELEEVLGAEGSRLEDVELVVLTHQHSDHHGLAHVVRERSGCRVAGIDLLRGILGDWDASAEDEDVYQAEVMRLNGVPEETILTLRTVSRAYRHFGASVEIDQPLRDGDTLEAGDRTFTVHLRPGHSPTDTVFIDEQAGVGFAGDHLLARVSSNPVVHRPLDRPPDARRRESTLARYLDSLRRTGELEVETLYAGHGGPVAGHRALVAERIDHHQKRKERVFEELAAGARTAYSIARSIWGDIAIREAYLTLSEVLGALDLLIAEGRVAQLDEDDSIRYETT